MLKLKLQSFGRLMRGADSLEETLMLGKTEGRGGGQRMRRLGGIADSVGLEMVEDRGAGALHAVHGVAKSATSQLSSNSSLPQVPVGEPSSCCLL